MWFDLEEKAGERIRAYGGETKNDASLADLEGYQRLVKSIEEVMSQNNSSV